MAEERSAGTRWFQLAVAAALLLALVMIGQQWFRFGPYEPNAWHASGYLKVAFGCACLNVLIGAALWLGFIGRRHAVGFVRILATVALVAVAFRVAFPPEFGLGFAGFEIDTVRLAGAWLGLGAAAVSAIGAWLAR